MFRKWHQYLKSCNKANDFTILRIISIEMAEIISKAYGLLVYFVKK